MPNSEYLADELITAAQEEGIFPASAESSFTPRIRRLMNREQRLYLMEVLQSAREEYQVAHLEVALVAGTLSYEIPARAVAAGLKLVELVTDANNIRQLYPIKQETASSYPNMGMGTGDYYLSGNVLTLLSNSFTGTLRLTYFRRFNTMVAADEAAEITAIDTSTGEVTLDTVPTEFASTTPFDFIRATPHFDILAMDLDATLSGSVLTFTAADLPSGLAVGDYVALAGQTPVCNAPLEMQDLLVKRAVYVYLLGQGDPKSQAAKVALDESQRQALSLLTPRVEGSPKSVINMNAPGFGRWARRRGY